MSDDRWTRHRLDQGVLDAEQHLEWDARWLAAEGQRAELARIVEQEHLRSVERFSLGLLRCGREGPRLACRLPMGAVALSFLDEPTQITPERVVRRWTIEPSFLARRVLAGQGSVPTYGRLEIGVERRAEARVHGWMGVTAFPSRFLTPLPRGARRLAFLWQPVGHLYALFHAQTSFSCLRGVARAMHSLGE